MSRKVALPALAGALALGLGACGGGDGPLPSPDGMAAGAGDAGGGLPSTCTGECAATTIEATFGGATRGFERAFFGLTAPSQSASGGWELHVEAAAGGDAGCPTEASPTPERTLVIASFAVPEEPAQAAAPSVSLLDYEGSLLPTTPVASATATTLTWVAADPCVACAEGAEPDRAGRFVAFDLDAAFEGGSAGGRVHATHCASLDAL